MFCWKCGKELPDGAKFCFYCGERTVESRQENGENSVKVEDGLQKVSNGSTFGERLDLLKDYKGTFWGAVACLLVSLLLLGGEMFEITYQLFSEHSVRLTMFDGRETLKLILILANLIVIALMLAPLVTGKNYERYNLVPAVIISIANVLILLIIMMYAKEQMNESLMMDAVRAKASLTGNGWVFLIANCAAILLALNVENVVPKTVSQETPDAENEDNANRPYRCAFCDLEGPYEGDCPRCGSVSKKYIKL